ncbi:hypothetical protein [Streptomyces sp. NRRL S-350]|uniref:hypothetical protein n=1 Tax=Streptomyces sp. NRRL S-350 TaxID=1463902 RepID=UPI0004C0A1C4|nr:hypothetical protein [Streptomyces sp. NRRL S-350]
MTPEPTQPRGARRRWRLPVAAALGLPLAAGAVFYLGGGYDRWQDGRSLAGLCHGSLDTAEVKEFLGVDRMRGEDAVSPDGPAACSVVNPEHTGGFLSVKTGWGQQGSAQALAALRRDRADLATTMAAPLGYGRRGVLDLQEDDGAVAVLPLDCPGQGGKELLVTVKGLPRTGGLDDAAQRARFARIAARTADGAARVWGCTAPSGPDITDVPADTRYRKVPAGQAAGTCSGLDGTTGETAADPNAPVEDCFLYDAGDSPRFRLGAYYPPFADALPKVAHYPVAGASGSRDGLLWATASCPGGGTALYTVDTVDDGKRTATPDPAAQGSALRTFATRSAERHGCAAPQLP